MAVGFEPIDDDVRTPALSAFLTSFANHGHLMWRDGGALLSTFSSSSCSSSSAAAAAIARQAVVKALIGSVRAEVGVSGGSWALVGNDAWLLIGVVVSEGKEKGGSAEVGKRPKKEKKTENEKGNENGNEKW